MNADNAGERANSLVWPAIGLATVIGALLHLSLDSPSAQVIIWGTLTVLVGTLIAFAGSRRFDLFSPIFFLGMSFAVFYGLAGILAYLVDDQNLFAAALLDVRDFLPAALLGAYASLISLFFGYSVLWPALRVTGAGFLGVHASDARLYALWLLLYGAGCASFAISIATGTYYHGTTEYQSPLFHTAVGYLRQAFVVALPLAFAQALLSRRAAWNIAACLSIVTFFGFAILSGAKGLTVVAMLLPLIALNYAYRRFTVRHAALLMVVGAAVVFLYFPFNALQREYVTSSGAEREQTLADTATSAREAWTHLRELQPDEAVFYARDYLTLRLSNIAVVARILKRNREGADLSWGETYARFVYAFVPRLIWPDKPAVSISNRIAVELGYADPEAVILGEQVSSTAVGITLLGEFVYNFPIWLSPLGFALLGLLFRWLHETFLRGYRTAPAFATGVYAYWWHDLILYGHESNMAATMSGAIKITVIMLLLLWVLGAVDNTRYPRPSLMR